MGLFKSIFLYKTVEKARIFSSSFEFFFFLVYTFYILPLKLFLLHSCFTETQTPTALLGPTCTLNILSHCLISAVSCIMRRECALSLEIPINQVTRESIFVRFFIRNSREHDNI